MGFGKNFIEDSVVSETGNWNVAQSYSEGIIMGQLRYIKYLQTVAEVGTDEPMQTPEDVNFARYDALKRFVQALKQLISDTKFALRKKADKELFDQHYQYIKRINKSLSSVTDTKVNSVRKSRTFEIKEDTFEKYLDVLDSIKMELYEIINKSDLIYPTKEEFDPKAFKEAIIKRATTQG